MARGEIIEVNDKESQDNIINGINPKKPDEINKTEIKMTLSKVTMEPVLAGAILAISLSQTSFQNFYLESACLVDLGQPKNSCIFGFAEKVSSELESQTLVASVNISRGFIGSGITALVLLFLGPWSDFSGRRKPTILLPLFGMMLASLGLVAMVFLPRLPVLWVTYAVTIPMAVGGSFTLLLNGTFNYLGDICYSTGRDATSVMGSNRAAIQAATVAGAVLGPITYRTLGFFGVFLITFLLQLSSFIYAFIYVKDVNINKENKLYVFNIRLPAKALKSVFRKREAYRRCSIILMILVASLDRLITSGDVSVSYMFMRNQFDWSDILYGIFLSYRNILAFFGTLLILNVLRKRFSASDCTIGIIGGVSQSLSILLMILASNNYTVFTSGLVGILAQGILVVQRPVMNRQIKANEQGKITSITGALDSIVQLVINPLYNYIYRSTAVTFASAFLCISLAAGLTQTLFFLITKRIDVQINDVEEPINKDIKH